MDKIIWAPSALKDIKSIVEYVLPGVCLAVASTLLGRGSFTHQLTVLIMSFWIGLPLLRAV